MAKSKVNPKYSPYKSALVLVLTVAFSAVMYFSDQVSYMLRASILGFPEHEAFDGTVYPVKKTPDWVHMTDHDRTLDYSDINPELLQNIPYYDPDVLAQSTDGLSWGNAEHNKIRNTKVTYSVPYMGNYKLDGKEYAGSHAAVDIKIPMYTPIHVIANGTVVKTSSQSNGFGYHIVVRHNNFPSANDPNVREVYYSSYSHLSSIFVQEGQVVKKDQQIALSGNTGTSTAPHLHFQIDNESAPWHPFWPFDWKDQREAGLSFFEAVNAGLGREKALATTIHPMKYVQKYLNGFTNVASETSTASSAVVASAVEPEPVKTPVVNNIVAESAVSTEVESTPEVAPNESSIKAVVATETPEKDERQYERIFKLELTVESEYDELLGGKFRISLRDQDGFPYLDGLKTNITIASSKNNFEADIPTITKDDFDASGNYVGDLKNFNIGKDKLIASYNSTSMYSDWFTIKGNSEGESVFKDVPATHKYAEAINYLSAEGVVGGYPDGTFKPDNTVSRVEALKFIYEGIKEAVNPGGTPFSDVSESEWYSKYIYTAYSQGVVGGYPDGSFKPAKIVNKAEFYKILFNGMGVDVSPVVEVQPFMDVPTDAWFAPYVSYAKELGIIDLSIVNLSADRGMTRGEVADAIFRLMEVMK